MPLCSVCHREFRVKQRDMKFFGLGTPQFDCPECLRQYVCQLPAAPAETLSGAGLRTPEVVIGEALCYSPVLHMSFRSGFEVVVAETLVASWGWAVQYEPHAIPVAERKLYIPDFWLPDFGCWLEVKGCWHSGDKKKFIQASHLVGPERIVLLPNQYRKWFVKEAEQVRRARGLESVCL